MRAKILGLTTLAAVAILFGSATLSWACTPQVGIAPLTQAAGPTGTQLSLTGNVDRTGPVEIRWNSVKGPLLGKAVADRAGARGMEFATDVTIPEAMPGVYYFYMLSSDGAVGRAPFEVLPPPSASRAGEPSTANRTRTEPGLWRNSLDQGAAPAVQSTPGLTAGIAILGLGMVTLLAGSGVVALRRKSRVTGA